MRRQTTGLPGSSSNRGYSRIRQRFKGWMLPLAALGLSFFLAESIYVEQMGMGVERGIMASIAVRSILLAAVALVALLLLYKHTIAAKPNFSGRKITLYYASFLVIWPGVIYCGLFLFGVPYQAYDAVRYYRNGIVLEKDVRITRIKENCGPSIHNCTLEVSTAQGDLFDVNGYVQSYLEKNGGGSVLSFRYLPASQKIINFRTSDGWK